MKTSYVEIAKHKVAIIVELEDDEVKLLDDGSPLTVRLETTFHNSRKLDEKMEKFFQEVEDEHNRDEFFRLSKELEKVREKLKI